MFFLKPVNILTVARFRLYVVAALATFWSFFFSFFLAPLWASGVLAIIHLIALVLAVSQGYRLMAYVFLSKAGEGDSAPRVKTDARADPPD